MHESLYKDFYMPLLIRWSQVRILPGAHSDQAFSRGFPSRPADGKALSTRWGDPIKHLHLTSTSLELSRLLFVSRRCNPASSPR
jgi:hypothetical protein